jgi:transposase
LGGSPPNFLPSSIFCWFPAKTCDRLAAKVKPQYDALATELRQAPALHSDETSWWVAGPGWWLWVFTTQLLTFYVVAQSRGPDLLDDILGKDFGGVLVTDCLAIYDDTTAVQQKCYAHQHKAIRKAKDLHPQQGEGFLCEVAAMLRAAVALQKQKAELSPQTFSDLRLALKTKLFNYWSLPAVNPTKSPCAIASINSAIISLPFWITMGSRLLTIWRNANCAPR